MRALVHVYQPLSRSEKRRQITCASWYNSAKSQNISADRHHEIAKARAHLVILLTIDLGFERSLLRVRFEQSLLI